MDVKELLDLANLDSDKTLIAEDANQILVDTRAKIWALAEVDPAALSRPENGDLSFESIEGRILEALRLCREISQFNLLALPLRTARQLADATRDLTARASELRDFSLRQGSPNPRSDRDRLAQRFDEVAAAFVGVAVTSLGYLAARAMATTSAAAPEKALREIERAANQAGRLASEIKAMADVSSAHTRQIGINSNARYFAGQAAEHDRWAKYWLLASSLSLLLTGSWAAHSYLDVIRRTAIATSQSGPSLVQLAIAKVLIFSTLLGLTVWCARNYRAHRHNYVVNRHRQNALSSFETFVSSTEDPQVKNAVLVQATASIFSPQSTGYSTLEPEAGSPQLIELVRTVASSKP